ncbi:MAG: sigma-70 family RNA polymerase sigma factor [Thermodesulfobacteriota bacterium]
MFDLNVRDPLPTDVEEAWHDFEFEDDRLAEPLLESSLDVYLCEMKLHPRISPERELVLGKRIKKGLELILVLLMDGQVNLKKMNTLRRQVSLWEERKIRPNPSVNEMMGWIRDQVTQLAADFPHHRKLDGLRRRLTRIEKKVRQAMDELVTSNLRLVVKMAKGYLNRGLAFEDLIQEGNLGLIKASGKYDYTTGFRFSTYASWWIRQSITRAIYDKARTVRLPVHLLETRNAFYKAYFKLMKDLGREPEIEEVACAIGATPETIESLILAIKDPVCLDSPRDDEDVSLGETLMSEDEVSPLEMVTYRELCLKVREVLAGLPVREEKVLRERFGLESDERVTLEQLGKDLKISRERVRQLENQALNRLRHSETRPLLAALV